MKATVPPSSAIAETVGATTLNNSRESISRSSDEMKEKASGGNGSDEEAVQGPNILPAKKFIPIYIGLLLSCFLIALDNTVISTAQVSIVKDLGGENLILWLPTAFLLTQATFTLTFGQLLQSVSSKYLYLFSLLLFEVGSLVCALAPSISTVIGGRALAGIGAAGLFVATFQILIETTTVAARAMYLGLIGAFSSISMVVAPSIGGALSQDVSWRWCFWINLPCAAVTAAGVVFILKPTKPLGSPLHKTVSLREKLSRIDVVGTLLVAGFMTMILVPLQDSTSKGWVNAATLAPICCSVLVLPLLWFWFRYIGEDRALVPLSLFRDRNLIGCAVTSFFGYWNAIAFIYMIPFFYQTVRGSSPIDSGVNMLAMMITSGLFSLGTGIMARKFGQYYPYMPFATVVGSIGAGLLYTQTGSSSLGFRIGTQILLGASFGPLLMSPTLAVQANTVDKKLISKATAVVLVAQRFGGGIGGSVASAILYSQLGIQIQKRLPVGVKYVPIDPSSIYALPSSPQREAYLAGLTKTIDLIFVSGVPIYIMALFSILFLVKITNIRTDKVTKKTDLLRSLRGIKKSDDKIGDAA